MYFVVLCHLLLLSCFQLVSSDSENGASSNNLSANTTVAGRAALSEIAREIYRDLENTINVKVNEDLETWTAPEEFQRSFPYYLSGYDDNGRPIWVIEAGKYNFRKFVEQGPKMATILDKHVLQFAFRCLKSIREQKVQEATGIVDYEDMQTQQYLHTPTLTYLIALARRFQPLLSEYSGGILIVNANFAAESMINIFRPVLGQLMETVDVHGTERGKWMPAIRRMFPANAIPGWYGGHKDFKPVQVYG